MYLETAFSSGLHVFRQVVQSSGLHFVSIDCLDLLVPITRRSSSTWRLYSLEKVPSQPVLTILFGKRCFRSNRKRLVHILASISIETLHIIKFVIRFRFVSGSRTLTSVRALQTCLLPSGRGWIGSTRVGSGWSGGHLFRWNETDRLGRDSSATIPMTSNGFLDQIPNACFYQQSHKASLWSHRTEGNCAKSLAILKSIQINKPTLEPIASMHPLAFVRCSRALFIKILEIIERCDERCSYSFPIFSHVRMRIIMNIPKGPPWLPKWS